MPYEPTTWKSGDVVTSAKLNKIEGGIASCGVLVVTDNDGTLDKTWQEIHDAGFAVILSFQQENLAQYVAVQLIGIINNTYAIRATNGNTYLADSASDYPQYQDVG